MPDVVTLNLNPRYELRPYQVDAVARFLALVNIILLWVAIAGTTVVFWRVVPAAGWLFMPYLAWVSFAAALNYAIWRLNCR